MSGTIQNQYCPDYAVHPGEVLEETLQARDLTKRDVAERCGISAKHLNQIIHGKSALEPGMAISFERVLCVPAQIWTNLQCNYDLHHARAKARQESEASCAWARRFPVTEMLKRNWIQKPEDKYSLAAELFQFFGVGNIDAWEHWFGEMAVAYRASSSFERAPESVAAWLRRGEVLARGISVQPYEAEKFRSALEIIRRDTMKKPSEFEPNMKRLCAESGVALVFLSELPKTHLSGAARWLSKDKALIMLSLRHKANDHFWFSFFHEAAHILLHGKRMLFLDDVKSAETTMEVEANRFAGNLLIPEKEYQGFVDAHPILDMALVTSFARQVAVAPGVVVGRLQHDEKIGFSEMNNLKQRFLLVENN